MPERSRFKDLRERVALKWARRALAALAALTKDQDADGRRYDGLTQSMVNDPPAVDHHYTVMPCGGDAPYVAEQGATLVTPSFRQEETGAQSLRTLYPQLAEHPSHSRMRAQVIAGRAQQWPHLAKALAEARILSTFHQWEFPSAYVRAADEGWNGYAEDRVMQATDSVVLSTTYARDVSYIFRVDLAPIIFMERVVSWKVADEPYAGTIGANSRPTTTQMALERSADAFLRECDPNVGRDDNAAEDHRLAVIGALLAGDVKAVPDRPRLIRLDVVDRWTRQPTVTPDRAAFRGVVRRRIPSPVRYRVAQPADGWSDSVWSCSLGIVPLSCTEYRTDRVGHDFAWIGHRKITTGERARVVRKLAKRRAATTLKRGVATGARGIARNGWTLSDRSLPRAWSRADAGQHAVATLIVAQLTAFAGSVLAGRTDVTHLSDTLAVATDGINAWRISEHGPSRAFTVQAFARRAALAREDVA